MSNDTETYFNVPQPRVISFTLLNQQEYPTALTLNINFNRCLSQLADAFHNPTTLIGPLSVKSGGGIMQGIYD